MTLSRQLLALITLLFALVFAGTLAISVQNTRNYLVQQLASHAQDAATSLGLSITPFVEQQDMATVGSMVDAIFDRGDYLEVTIRDISGARLLQRRLPLDIDGVPPWFIEHIALEVPPGESLVMSGWLQAATLEVRSHPGYAYAQLWRDSLATFWWFLASTLVALVTGLLSLRLLLRPLHQVEGLANAICEHEFPQLTKLPKTRELRRIVEAMNRMSAKVRRMLGAQEELAESLREQAYLDSVTGLGNRRYFDRQLGHAIAARDEFHRGALALVRLKDFKTYNERHGYPAGDALLREAASNLQEACAGVDDALFSRLSGADFAVLLPGVYEETATALGQGLARALSRLHQTGGLDTPDVGSIGIACYRGTQSPSELVAQADMALRVALGLGGNAWHQFVHSELTPTMVQGASTWRALVQRALAAGDIALHFQPVVSAPGRQLLHYEAFARIRGKQGEWLAAGLFMPSAEGLGLTTALDRQVLAKVLQVLAGDHPNGPAYAVNLSPSSLRDPAFVDWLIQALEDARGTVGRLVLEWPEYGALAQLPEIRQLIERLRPLGTRFCLDHFGRGFNSFGYLHSLKIDCLKVDGSVIRALDSHSENRFLLRSLTEIAHGLDIQVFAEAIETEQEWQAITDASVDGGQGYWIAAPKERHS